MDKINWFNLKAGREIRVHTLIQAGFDLEAGFYSLNYSKLDILCECMKADGYKYDSPLGRSRLCSYWYSLQRAFSKMNKH